MFASKAQPGRTVLLATFTLVAFAANSVFCRLALGENAIDAAPFSTLRLVVASATILGGVWLAILERSKESTGT